MSLEITNKFKNLRVGLARPAPPLDEDIHTEYVEEDTSNYVEITNDQRMVLSSLDIDAIKVFALGVSSEDLACYARVARAMYDVGFSKKFEGNVKHEWTTAFDRCSLLGKGVIDSYVAESNRSEASRLEIVATLNQVTGGFTTLRLGKGKVEFSKNVYSMDIETYFNSKPIVNKEVFKSVDTEFLTKLSKDERLSEFCESVTPKFYDDDPVVYNDVCKVAVDFADRYDIKIKSDRPGFMNDIHIGKNSSARAYSNVASKALDVLFPSVGFYEVGKENNELLTHNVFPEVEGEDPMYNNFFYFRQKGNVGDPATNTNAWRRLGMIDDPLKNFTLIKAEDYDNHIIEGTEDIVDAMLNGIPLEIPTNDGDKPMFNCVLTKCTPISDFLAAREPLFGLVTLDMFEGAAKKMSEFYRQFITLLICPLSQLCIVIPAMMRGHSGLLTEFFQGKGIGLCGNYFRVQSTNVKPCSKVCSSIYLMAVPYISTFSKKLNILEELRNKFSDILTDFYNKNSRNKFLSNILYVFIAEMQGPLMVHFQGPGVKEKAFLRYCELKKYELVDEIDEYSASKWTVVRPKSNFGTTVTINLNDYISTGVEKSGVDDVSLVVGRDPVGEVVDALIAEVNSGGLNHVDDTSGDTVTNVES